jgi:tetratricopeptide (TPR) repeat protein
MNKLVYILYLFIPACALLVFGATGEWPETLVEALCFFLLLLHLLSLRRQAAPLYKVPGFLPLTVLTGYILIQMVPLPPLMLKLLSPNTWELYTDSIWLVRPGAWMPISIAPKATLAEFFRLAAYAVFYLMTVQVLAERERLKEALSFFSICIGLFALAGLVMFLLSGGRFFWPLGEWMFEPGRSPAGFAKSHYAGLMAMVLPVVLAHYLATRPRVNYSSLRGRIVDFFHHPGSNLYVLLGFFLLPLAASFLLSFSTSGILSGLAGLLLFMLLLLIRGWTRKKGVLKGLFPTAVLLVVALLGCGMIWGRPDPQADRFRDEGIRKHVWRDSGRIIGDFPLLGTGMGTFARIYPRYKTISAPEAEINHARNEYLEHMIEAGLAGTLLAGWFLFSLVRQTYPVWRKRHNRTSVYICAGSFSGLVAILLHSITGSTLHAGAIGLYLFFFAGLVFAAATCLSPGRIESEWQEEASPATARWIGLSVIVLLGASLTFNVGILMGEHKIHLRNDSASGSPDPGQEPAEVEKAAGQAMRLDPLESTYPYLLADARLASGEAGKTLDLFSSALRLNPLNAGYLQRIGLVFDNLGQREKAEKLLRSGVENDGSNPERHKTFAFWLLSEGKKDKGLDHIREAIYWGPRQTGEFLALMALYGLKDEEMQRVLPERSYPLLAFGDYLRGIGKEQEAEKNYRASIDYAIQEEWPSPLPFKQVAEFFTERTRYSDALDVILAGIEIFPENAEFRFLAANLYELLGIEYRAIEEYRGTLALDPGKQEARESLKRLTGNSN